MEITDKYKQLMNKKDVSLEWFLFHYSLNLPESQNVDPVSDNMDRLTLKAVVKWRNHPTVLAITTVRENREKFTFSPNSHLQMLQKKTNILNSSNTAWKLSKCGVFSGPYLDTFFAAKNDTRSRPSSKTLEG